MANGYGLLCDLALLPEEPHLLQLCCLTALACGNTWDSPEASFCTGAVSPACVLIPSSPHSACCSCRTHFYICGLNHCSFPGTPPGPCRGRRLSLTLSGQAVLALGNTFGVLLAGFLLPILKRFQVLLCPVIFSCLQISVYIFPPGVCPLTAALHDLGIEGRSGGRAGSFP